MDNQLNADIENAYKTIADHIKADEGQCVLILGPELAVNKKGEGYKSHFRELKKNKSLGIEEYYESDNLFSFSDDLGLRNTRTAVKDYYQHSGDPVLLDMIARLKFSLIINLCPDNSIETTYKNKGIAFESGYFIKPPNNSKFADLPAPSKEKPVIYNIFGSIKNDPSLILTHSKLYETIEYLLPENSLPKKIEEFLNLANSFVLLGVKFDSWYYQLICHKLRLKQGNDIRTNLGTGYSEQNNSVSMVVKKSFGLLFTPENPVQSIEKIISSCNDNAGALRKKDEHGQYSLFVSYSWRDKDTSVLNVSRQTPVDYLQNFSMLKSEESLQFFRDHTDVDYGDSIESFMTRIGMGKTVIRVISDRYLRSVFCMTEAMLIDKYNDGDKRIFTIFWEDVELENENKYLDYWGQKCKTILTDLDKNLENQKYDYYVRIYRFILPFITKLKDNKSPWLKASDFAINAETGVISVTDNARPEVEKFVNTIISKLKEV
jgi:hypothetical protein